MKVLNLRCANGHGFEGWFASEYRRLMRAKLGLVREEEGDDRLIGELLALMAKGRASPTNCWRAAR